MGAEADPEKGDAQDSSATLTSQHQHTGAIHHAGRRIRHFVLASGKRTLGRVTAQISPLFLGNLALFA